MSNFSIILVLLFLYQAAALIPPKFQWKVIDFAWDCGDCPDCPDRKTSLANRSYIPTNNMPTGIARWKDKLFITIPRWKPGVPSSLNYVYLSDPQDAPLRPYPNWKEACLSSKGGVTSNSTVVCTFRVHVDKCNRLWVVDNGVNNMATDVKQVTNPAILVFDLTKDKLIKKYDLPANVLTDASVLTSITVETVGGKCGTDAFAYITDMGSNAVIVYSMKDDDAWRVQNHYFHFDPHAGGYSVGEIDFYWSDGVSSATLSKPNKDGYCTLYLHPTSSTKLFSMSTKLLRNKNAPPEDIFNGVEMIGDRGPKSQATACDIDPSTDVMFYTQVCKNGLGCWNMKKEFNPENTPLILSDCNIMEFPDDVKVCFLHREILMVVFPQQNDLPYGVLSKHRVKADNEGNIWILSDRQSRFLYDTMDFNTVNFRVLTAPTSTLIKGTSCEGSKWVK